MKDLLDRLSKALALPRERLRSRGLLPLPSPEVQKMVEQAFEPCGGVAVAVRLVRNVAPTRHMFCVCFRVQDEAPEGRGSGAERLLEGRRARFSMVFRGFSGSVREIGARIIH